MATDKQETAGQKVADAISAALRGRNALIVVQTPEEQRGERLIFDAATKVKNPYNVYAWTATEGLTDINGKEVEPGKAAADPSKILQTIRDWKGEGDKGARSVWILRDFHAFTGNAMVCRALRSLARSLSSLPTNQARAIVILTPVEKIPVELVDHAVVVKVALPDRAEIGSIFESVMSPYKPEERAEMAPNGTKEAAVEAAVGLSAEAVGRAFIKSLVTRGKRIVPSAIAAEKKAVVSARGVEWYEVDPRGLDGVGGNEILKGWLRQRKSAFSERARAFGLPPPRGIIIVGPPGTGKTLSAKCVAAAWGVPLLRFDAGAQKGGIVGESERNTRAAYATAEAVGSCVLLFDEIEKMFGGAQGALDGGVSADALGTFLTWMQEKKTDVFVVATANSIDKLPPEMLRKGRFDELFFVDLPTQVEREEIIKVSLAKCGRDVSGIDVAKVAAACVDFSGVETAELVPNALYVAFADGERALTTEDLLAGARSTVPLAKTSAEKIKGLREWAKGRTRPASTPEVSTAATGGRSLDLGE